MSTPDKPEIAALQRRIVELEQQLLQSQKLATVGELASSMTHEFNNILTTIINYAKLGLRHKDHPTREKALDKILNAGLRAAKITTGALAFSRRGKADGQREVVDLVDLVQDVLVLVEKDLKVHRVRLQTQFDGHPTAAVNVGQVQQVLVNLIVNARQAMPSGGHLSVTVRPSADAGLAEIAIRDSGQGMAPEVLQRIFEPYFTTKATDSQGQGGTGLGLSLARQVIESHQGRIRVDSAVGQGTTFTLKLPLAKLTVVQKAG